MISRQGKLFAILAVCGGVYALNQMTTRPAGSSEPPRVALVASPAVASEAVPELSAAKKAELAKAMANRAPIERKEFAERLERTFLEKWRDAEFKVSGPANTTLTMRYILVSRPFVHNLSQDGAFFERAEKAGFKRLVFSNGHTQKWTYDLQAQKWL